MEKRTLKQFHQTLDWSTRIYFLIALVVIIGAFLFNAWTTNWVLTILTATAVVFFVEAILISIARHPRLWNTIKWWLLLLLALFLLAG